MKTVWRLKAPAAAEKKLGKHPTQKPLELIERCLLASTHAGDFVLDPFAGGGTTPVACVRTKRHGLGVELETKHVELAVRRLEQAAAPDQSPLAAKH